MTAFERPLPARNPDLEIAEFETEFVVFEPRCSEVHELGGLTAVVFDACDGATSIEALAAEIASALMIGVDEAHAHVADSLVALAAADLLATGSGDERPP